MGNFRLCPLEAKGQVKRSRGSDVRGFPNHAGARLVAPGAAGRLRVLVVEDRPAVAAVADEGVGLLRARHPEVGLARAHEGGHAGEGDGDLENRRAVVPPPRRAHALLKHSGGGAGGGDKERLKRGTHDARRCVFIIHKI